MKSKQRSFFWLSGLTALLTGVVLVFVALRQRVMTLHCLKPGACTADQVAPWERIAIGRWDPTLNFWSFVTQDLAGVIALLLPLLFRNRRVKLNEWGHYAFFLVNSTLVNVMTNEIVRMIFQRPRPFVYQDPAGFGTEPSHYTSFYSGHTSFAAMSMMTCILYFWDRKEKGALRLSIPIGILLVVATGTLRVVAGRHFPTDVIFGALGGIWVALFMRYLAKPSS